MNWLLREKSDGRRAPGYLVYLLGGLAAVAVVWALHRRVAGPNGPAAARPRVRGHSHVAALTQSAASPASLTQVEIQDQPAPATADLSTDSFDPVAAALGRNAAAAAAGGEQPDAGSGPEYPRPPPAFPASASHPSQAWDRSDQLWGYRDSGADSAGVAAGAPAATGAPSAEFRIPRGSLLRVFLLTRVDTGNPGAVIQFGAAADFFFNHRRQIPFGTRFLGKLAGQALRDRLDLTADTIVYPDGLELPVSASAVEADDDGTDIRTGVAADFLPAPAWAQIAPYLADFFTGAMGLVEARAQPQFTVGVGGMSLQAGSAAGQLKGSAAQSAAQAIQDYTQARLKEFEQRQAACYIIPAGTACWLQLDADLDLRAAQAGPDSADR